jgi:ribosome-binding ATPase
MSLSAGLVGLPNVGKSTLFNALTRSQVPAANYPFCTIEPHKAIAPVPDERLQHLQKLYHSGKTIPAVLECYDIAGLVAGASTGQGLGNKFLGHIKSVDLIMHVVRCFEDGDIVSAHATVDPIRDFNIIVTELMLKDIECVDRRLQKLPTLRKAQQSKPAALQVLTEEEDLLHMLRAALDSADLSAVQKLGHHAAVIELDLLSTKPYIIIANVSEQDCATPYRNKHVQELIQIFGSHKVIALSARTESEIVQADPTTRTELMAMLDMSESGLDHVIRSTYKALGYITFFTCGPQEIHAWQVTQTSTIREAAGCIHSDLQTGFICAEVVSYQDIAQAGSYTAAKDQGLVRIEGERYLVHDGDIVLIRFNVS